MTQGSRFIAGIDGLMTRHKFEKTGDRAYGLTTSAREVGYLIDSNRARSVYDLAMNAMMR